MAKTAVARRARSKNAAVELQRRVENEIVSAYARIDGLRRELRALEKEARAQALELYEADGLAVLYGDDGVVTIKEASGAQRIDTKRVRDLLTEEELRQVTVQDPPTVRVTFTARDA